MTGLLNLPKPISSAEQATGKRLASIRRSKGLTQKDLADKLDVTQSMISDYENGVMRLHAELILQLSSILGVTTDELLGANNKHTETVTDRRLSKRLLAISQLPKRDQDTLIRTIDAFVERDS